MRTRSRACGTQYFDLTYHCVGVELFRFCLLQLVSFDKTRFIQRTLRLAAHWRLLSRGLFVSPSAGVECYEDMWEWDKGVWGYVGLLSL